MVQNKRGLLVIISVICFLFLFIAAAMPSKAEGDVEEQSVTSEEPTGVLDEQPQEETEPTVQEIWKVNVESYTCGGQQVENVYCKKEITPNICITDPEGNKFTNPKTITYGGKEYSVSYEGQMCQINATKLMPYIVKVVLTAPDVNPTTLWTFWRIQPKLLPKVQWSGKTSTLPVVSCNQFNVYPNTGKVVHPEAYVVDGVCSGDEVTIETFTLEPSRINSDYINGLNKVLEQYLKNTIKDTMVLWPTEATQYRDGGYWEVGAIPGGKDGDNYTTVKVNVDIPDGLLESMIEAINPSSDGYSDAQQKMEASLSSGNDVSITVDGVGMDKLQWFNIKGQSQAADLNIPNVDRNVPTGINGSSWLMIGVAFVLIAFVSAVIMMNLKRKNH